MLAQPARFLARTRPSTTSIALPRPTLRLRSMATVTPQQPTSGPVPINTTTTTTKPPSSPSYSSYSPTKPPTITATATEVQHGRLSPQNLEAAVRAIHLDGLVVVENAIPDHSILDRLNAKMVADAQLLRGMKEGMPFNYNKGNLQQDAPPVKEWFSPEVFLNPLATQITSSILGPRPKLTFCSGNTAMPPTPDSPPQRQPVHSDADFAHPLHPFALVVNVPLVTMTPENGSTEVWLGTQNSSIADQEGAHGDRASGRIREELLEDRRKVAPPVQPVVSKGSVIVRDLRLWHGMPNHSNGIRVMLAMIHFANWYRNQMRLQFGEGVRPFFEDCRDLDVRADFMPEEKASTSYLGRGFGNSYDFNQSP